jgi:hypothetical protein
MWCFQQRAAKRGANYIPFNQTRLEDIDDVLVDIGDLPAAEIDRL